MVSGVTFWCKEGEVSKPFYWFLDCSFLFFSYKSRVGKVCCKGLGEKRKIVILDRQKCQKKLKWKIKVYLKRRALEF